MLRPSGPGEEKGDTNILPRRLREDKKRLKIVSKGYRAMLQGPETVS